MRVVQLVPELNEGGVEMGVIELSREFVRRGIASVVISAGGHLVSRLEADGARHVGMDVASKNPLSVPWRAARLRQALAALQPDILHAHSRVPAWLACLANRSLRIPFVTTVHGFNSINPYSKVMTYGDRVICVSTAVRDYIRQHYRVPEKKAVVIPDGIDLDRFDPGRVDGVFMSDFSRRFGLEGRFVVTTVGRITRLKDHETFVRAVGLLRDEIPEALGLIVGGVREGKEPYFESLRQLVASLGLENHVRFTGSQSKVAEIYALSRVVVSSSSKPESFGRTAAEALAMNVPVVATGHGGITDIVLERETGFLFQPGDCEGLKSRIMLANTLRGTDFRGFVADNFSLGSTVEKTIRQYELCRSVPSGRPHVGTTTNSKI